MKISVNKCCYDHRTFTATAVVSYNGTNTPSRSFTVFSAVCVGAVSWKLPLTSAASFDPCRECERTARSVGGMQRYNTARPLCHSQATV